MKSCGYTLVVPEEAEVIIVNTCGFIQPAREESIDRILEAGSMKDKGKLETLIVTGCMGTYYRKELTSSIPEIDHIVPFERVDSIPDLLGVRPKEPVQRMLTTTAYAYLKIAEGCDHACSFCLIPKLTGPYVSRTETEILREAKSLQNAGVAELILVAQDTTRYGRDLHPSTTLTGLLRKLLSETNFPWIRVMYAYPETLNEGLLELMVANDRILPYLDIPLQHASSRVLKRMKRGGKGTRYMKMIDAVRLQVPDIALRTTFITGFPGETERAFENLLSFLRKAKFNHVGVFAYDDDPDLPSHRLSDHVTGPVVRERIQRIFEVQREISLSHHKKLQGTTVSVIIDEVNSQETLARVKGMAPEIDGQVRLPANETMVPGDIVPVRIEAAHPYMLEGRWV